MKKTHIIKYFLLLILILTISSWLILLANGYKINPQSHKLEKTGMIYLESTPKDVTVYINGLLKSTETPHKHAEIFPGRYDIKIIKPNFYDWQETLWVNPEQVTERKYIVLFYKESQKIELTNEEKNNYQKQFDLVNLLLNKNLFIKENNEIWFGDIFITRLSQNIKKAVWYFDKKHILYQVEKNINIMDVNGTNIISLVELNNDKTTSFFSEDGGESLVYKDGEDLKKIKITQNNGLMDKITEPILN